MHIHMYTHYPMRMWEIDKGIITDFVVMETAATLQLFTCM